MEDLTPEQIIQLGQTYFPELDGQQIIDIFEKYKEVLPKGLTNLQIAQVIKLNVDNYKASKGKPDLSGLKSMFKSR